MAQPLIIVESPAKARTIARLLGGDYIVESSIGHIRDLPSKPDEIPAAHRKKPWARLGVDIDNHFKPIYVVPNTKKAHVKKLKELLEDASMLYLATDEDREGEAIAWHLLEVLKPKVPIKRLAFHEITKRAIEKALENPRAVNQQLVGAQEARRILDRLFGYELSPVLWRKVRPRLSAGRVQSVATRLVVERERARMAFHSGAYWSVSGSFLPEKVDQVLPAELAFMGDRRIAVGRHFDSTNGKLSDASRNDNVLLLDGRLAEDIKKALFDASISVKEVNKKPFTQRPAPPFITSTLQQDAGRKLGYAAKRTMRVAQRLYESGFITYMRTDSTTLSQEALNAARESVTKLYGDQYLPDSPRFYTKKVKGAQEAHEAIRPAGERFRSPEEVSKELDSEALKLYDLIWKRTVACQMKDAKGERTQLRLLAKLSTSFTDSEGKEVKPEAILQASGKVITFAGFLKAYQAGKAQDEPDDSERFLPPLVEGDTLKTQEVESKEHYTQPPGRFTEAALVKVLEERGIGRPSTYATIIQTIQDRGYVWKQGNTLVPTLTAFAVVNLLERHFEELVDYEFTARMEQELDEISDGEKEARPWLESFYFGQIGKKGHEKETVVENGSSLEKAGLKGLIGSGVEHIDARDICSIIIGETESGDPIAARVGRYGPYIQVGDTERRASIADDVVLDELDAAQAKDLLRQEELANRVLGVDPKTDKKVYTKSGRFGPYVQLGEPELTPKGNIKKGGKPKMASLWPSMNIETITLKEALQLLSFPKELGLHPEHQAMVIAQDGKFGPFVQMEVDGKRETRSLENHEQLASIDLKGALELLAKPRVSRRGRQAAGPLAELGDSPITGEKITVRTGRFGPYVTDGQINATIPSHRDPAKITFDDAVELIATREQRLRDQGEDPRAPKKKGARKKATKKATTKKATKKAAKKTATKKATKKKATKKAVTKKAAKKKATKKVASKKSAS